MFGKAMKSIKGVFNDVKETVNTVSNQNSNTFTVNGKNYYEDKLLGEGGYGYVYQVSDSKGNKYALKKNKYFISTTISKYNSRNQIMETSIKFSKYCKTFRCIPNKN